MNLLIGLLNMHIEKDNRASYLKKKAEVLLSTKSCDFAVYLLNIYSLPKKKYRF